GGPQGRRAQGGPVMDFRIGRLFFRTYRCRGARLAVRVNPRERYLELWAGRRISYVAVLHREGCDCDPCALDRWLKTFTPEALVEFARENPPPQDWFDEELDDLLSHEGKAFEDESGDR